jgi:hypothetical protein
MKRDQLAAALALSRVLLDRRRRTRSQALTLTTVTPRLVTADDARGWRPQLSQNSPLVKACPQTPWITRMGSTGAR